MWVTKSPQPHALLSFNFTNEQNGRMRVLRLNLNYSKSKFVVFFRIVKNETIQ